MGLAGAAVADGDDVLPPVYVLAACQLHGQVLVHRRHGQEVEGVEALGGGEACRLDPAVLVDLVKAQDCRTVSDGKVGVGREALVEHLHYRPLAALAIAHADRQMRPHFGIGGV